MTNKTSSYRRILKTTSITGGASVINIFIGLVRTKVLAILIGPTGLGLISLYTGLMSTVITIASMGIGTAGTRQIADATVREDGHALAVARRAMFWGALLLAGSGALAVWALRDVLAIHVLGGIEHASIVGWLTLGVAFTVAGATQGALIQGMRRIGDMARLSIYSSMLSTILGILIIWRWGSAALWAFILVGPFVSFFLGHIFVSRLPKIATSGVSAHEIADQWKMLLRLGIPFMGAGLAGTLVQLWMRVTVNDELGLNAVGHFQAAWSLSVQYIGFVLGAMGADYYPRLTSLINDKPAASRLVNEQTEIALLLSAPLFIFMLGSAPWVIHLLYSVEFMPAVEVLRWQILGDILRVASWPLGFVILAAGAGKTFFWTETTSSLIMGGMVVVLVPNVGLPGTGISFLASYLYLTPIVYLIARSRIQFTWSTAVVRLLLVIFTLCVSVALLSSYTKWGVAASLLLAAIFSLYTAGRLSLMGDLSGRLGRIGKFARLITTKIGLKHE